MAQTILVADDSPTIQRLASGILIGEGLEVVTVPNGVAAIRKLPTVKPHLILADVSMPGKDGYEVCEFVKKSPELRHVPVLLIFSELEPYQKERGVRAGADGQIKKPFDQGTLVDLVGKFLVRSEESQAFSTALPDPSFESSQTPEPVEASAELEEQPEPNLISLSEGVAFTEFFGETGQSVLNDIEPGGSPGEQSVFFHSDPQAMAGENLNSTGPCSEFLLETPPEPKNVESAAPAIENLSAEPDVLPGAEHSLADSVAVSENLDEARDKTQADASIVVPAPTEMPAAETAAQIETQLTPARAIEAPQNHEERREQFDPEMIYSIVHKVVLRMSPPALMPEALEEVARRLAEEVAAEIGSKPS